MGRLTLRLPDTLHEQIASLAEEEGVSLNHFIVYALTRQVTLAQFVETSSEEREQQKTAYAMLLKNLGSTSDERVQAALKERQTVYSEPLLTLEDVRKLLALLPLWKQILEVSAMTNNEKTQSRQLTVGQLRESGLIGMWEDRDDIEDSATYARMLREQAQRREDMSYDPAG